MSQRPCTVPTTGVDLELSVGERETAGTYPQQLGRGGRLCVQTERRQMHPKSAWILATNMFLILGAGTLSYLLKYTIKPSKRGFMCGDLSIRFPYRDSTIPISAVLLIGNSIVILVLVFAEFYHRQRKFEPTSELYIMFGKALEPSFVRFIRFFLASLLGLAINIWIVYIVKFSFGQLRPHFLDVCRPNVNYNNCSIIEFFENYTCTTDADETSPMLKDSRLSFYSGHTSAAFYYASFIIIYLHARVGRFETSWSPIFAILYSIIAAVAALVGISRILDYKHHKTDVLAGAIVGVFIAAAVLYCHKHLFEAKPSIVGSKSDSEIFETEKSVKKFSAVSTQNSNV
ncbi:PAP2 superfamily domain-containing protein [Ditylenchus destructor]|nr:PAP2 superfamily domain-containing protein [Ditylenchus destructor]